MRLFSFLSVVFTGSLLIYAAEDFPDWGDPFSPANAYRVSSHYLTNAISETGVPNIVTSVLADYRGYDTLFETVVIFTAGIAIMGILRHRAGERDANPVGFVPDHREDPDYILIVASRLLIPVIQLFGLYVIAHGHHSPGGGFQGGVILGASLILLALTRDLQASLDRVPERRTIALANTGVLIYGGIGLLCMIVGGNFLDYSSLDALLPGRSSDARYHSILGVEIGVAFTVSAIMFSIYANLSSKGRLHGGM